MSLPVYISKLPVFYDRKYTDKDGRLTPDSYLFMDESFRVLGSVVNQFLEGLRVPIFPTVSVSPNDSSIERYRDDINVPLGTIWYDSTENKLYVKTVQVILDPFTPGKVEQVQSI